MSELGGAPAPEPLLPPLAAAVAIACVAGAGALANFSIVAALLKSSRNGVHAVLIQLAIADIIAIGTTIAPELWSFNSGNWDFGKKACTAYRGLNVFATTASLYLIATIALHTIATINLEAKAAARRSKRNEDEDDELRSSRHSLVANSDSSTPPRTMNVDYRLSDTRVAVTPPTIFVWVLSVSLSVPEFTLASTVRNQNVLLCTIADSRHRFIIHTMLIVFNVLLPMMIICIASILIITKLKSKRLSKIDCCDTAAALKLSLWLILTYVVLCAPRSIVNAYYTFLSIRSMNETVASQQIDENLVSATIIFVFSGTYLISTLIRPLLCIALLPNVRKIFCLGSRRTSTDEV